MNYGRKVNEQTLWGASAIDQLIISYIDRGGYVSQISEGVLGHGLMMLFGEGLKTTIVREVYLNEWSSAHSVRMYNKTPRKYEKYTG